MNALWIRCAPVVVLLALVTAVPAPAGLPTEQIKQTTNEILKIVSNPDLKDPAKAAERRKRIRALTDERFAWREMARRALGLYWRKTTDKQRNEFVSLFRELIERTYLGQIERYAGEKIHYRGETVEGKYGRVNVTIVTRKDTEIPIVYRVFHEKARPAAPTATMPATRPAARWVIYDVSIEGVSLVNNYRNQIRDIMAGSSYQELVKKLKAKIAESAAAAPAPGKSKTPSKTPDRGE